MKILDLIFPKKCFWCWKLSDYICKDCKKTLDAHPYMCPNCGKAQEDFSVCTKCKEKVYYNGIMIWFDYKLLIKKLLINLKYNHQKVLWEFMAQRLFLLMCSNPRLHQDIENKNILITYVPSHWIKIIFKRWYNQSKVIAEALSKISWFEIKPLCKKIKYNKSQVWLKREQRLQNQNWVFELIKNANPKNKTIIIVDDIITTSTTINQLSKTIKNSFPQNKIWWIVVWRHC